MSMESLLSRLPFRRWIKAPPTVSVVRLTGIIGQTGALRPGLTMAALAPVLERAFDRKGQAAVALVVNSPGGSPVQSSLIAGRIRALAAEKKVPVLAFTEDVAASGGYWLACAADEIWVDESSILGSIGVISAGFGFQDFIARHGIERRLHTSGERKSMLDPFRPERSEDVERLKAIQAEIHDSFKALVRERRAGRLKADDGELFSGAFWTGRRAVDLGLADGIGDLRSTLRRRFGDKVRLRLIEGDRRWLRRRLGMGAAMGGDWAGQAVAAALAAVEERALWGRFGL